MYLSTPTLFLLFLLPVLANTQSLYFPPNGSDEWETIAPTSLGYCQDSIDVLYDFLEENNSRAFLLLKDGKIVLEQYFGSFTQDSLWYWASAGKTLTAMIVGIAEQEGYLSLDEATSNYLGAGWTSCTPEQEGKISIWHQLSMTTGLNDSAGNPDCTEVSCLTYEADAGERWAYHNAPYTLLDEVLEAATGLPLNQYMNAKIRTPIGMNGAYVSLGFNKVFFSNPRSMARYGLLLLAEGIWDGTPVLDHPVFFDNMINSSQALNPSYGYLTWLNGKSSYMLPQLQLVFPGPLNEDAPQDMYAAWGKNGQLINVVPSQNLVWIRMGDPPSETGGLISPVFNNNIWKHINNLGCTTTSTSAIPAVEEDVLLFPNPVKKALSVVADQLIEHLAVYNSQGKLVLWEKPADKNAVVDLSSLPKGIYVIKMRLESGITKTEKVSVM
jgi:CubicO group peptidase (beta-lactamase class C family)